MTSDITRQLLLPSVDALLWQGKIRIAVALLGGVTTSVLLGAGVLPGSPAPLPACFGGYLALIVALCLLAKRVPGARSAAIAIMLLGDLALVFSGTVLSSSPEHYDRGLILSFVVLHLAEFCFGRVYAYFVAGVATSAYLALVDAAIGSGVRLGWGEELWSATAFLGTAVLFVQQYGGVQRRLGNIVALFERAEEGDFSQEYDVRADAQPDAVTAVGRAYNRLAAQLATMVVTDLLTGCLNRRGFDQALGREIARSSRAGSELALLAIDLDHFKRLNDRCGHLAGDAVLRELGALLRQTVRAGDVVGRTGGEEFTLILPDTDPAGGFQLATRLCDRIRDRAFIVGSKTIRITVSVGVAAAAGEAVDQQGHELKLRADQALYAAKRLGRDRVLTWSA